MRLFILVVSMLVISTSALAIETTDPAVPGVVYIYSKSGAAYVALPAKGCSDRGVYQLEPNHPKYDAIFSLLMAAKISDREVRVRFDDCLHGSNPRGRIIGAFLD